MPISAVNFGRWLDRLGFKHLDQPPFVQSVQPVSIVADHSMLVSPSLGPSGTVGGQITPIANGGGLLVKTTTPLLVEWWYSAANAAGVATYRSGPVASAPVLAFSTPLTPQPFTADGQPFRSLWTIGQLPAAPPITVPAFRLTTQASSFFLSQIYVAPGFFGLFDINLTAALAFAATFYEMPNENAQ